MSDDRKISPLRRLGQLARNNLVLSRELQPIRSFKSNLTDSTKTVRTHITQLFSVLGQAITVEIVHNAQAESSSIKLHKAYQVFST